MNKLLIITMLTLCALLPLKSLYASIITYDFEYENAGKTVAIGWFTVENIFSNNNIDAYIFSKSSGLLDFEITINNDFHNDLVISYGDVDSLSIYLSTGGGLLDFSKELIGQETLFEPWGTPPNFSNVPNGWADFSIGTWDADTGALSNEGVLFSNVWYFAQEFAVDKKVCGIGPTCWDREFLGMLSSLKPSTPITIPEPSTIALISLGFIGLGFSRKLNFR